MGGSRDDRYEVPIWVSSGALRRRARVDAAPEATIGDVARALASALGERAPAGLLRDRTGEILGAESAVSDANLRAGEELSLLSPEDAAARDALPSSSSPGRELVVVGGAHLGKRFPLPSGAAVVGRGSDADITIEDPALSARHLSVEVAGTVRIEDLGSRNGTFVDGGRVDSVDVDDDTVVEAGATLLQVRAVPRSAAPATTDRRGRILVNRPPRVRRSEPEGSVSIAAPPAEPGGPRLPLAASLVPLLVGAVLLVVMPGSAAMFVFFALSPVMAAASFVEDRRAGRRAFQRDAKAWEERAAEGRANLEALRTQWLRRWRDAHPDIAVLVARAQDQDPRLWERRPGDADDLALRLGWGDVPSPSSLVIEPGGSDALRAKAEAAVRPLGSVPAAPIVSSLAEAGVVGIAGDDRERLARWIAAQLAAHQSPGDVSVAAAGAGSEWHALEDLPHAWTGGPSVASDAATAQELLEALTATSAARAAAGDRAGPRAAWPVVVAIVDDRLVDRGAAQELLENGPRSGVYTIWLGRSLSSLPGACGVVALAERDSLEVTWPGSGRRVAGTADLLTSSAFVELAGELAPLVEAGGAGGGAALPREVKVMDLLAPGQIDAESVIAAWSNRRSELDAPLGLGPRGPVTIDLRSDGPHALVGGTTGSGKSELLQTLVVALATRHSPTRLTMLLIDYKGGAAFKDLLALPHVVGSVTDLDERLAARALASLDAEIKRRERILKDAGARDLAEMERTDPSGAPPSLVIVVDEFAALIKELPAFVDGIVDIAQRGRSLGLHLVLATQRPAGVINDAIRANTNLRIALRMSDDADSTDVIGNNSAARIPRRIPGRAFLRTGFGEVTEMQTAFAGLPARPVRDLPLVEVHLDGARSTNDGPTELDALVDAIRSAAERLALPSPARPWLPELPASLTLDDLGPVHSDQVAVGMIDDPRTQSQRPLILDLDRDSSALVFGMSGSGKTTLLRTIAASLVRSGTDVHIYGLDFASRALGEIEAWPKVGSIVPGEDRARVERLFAMLAKEVARRKDRAPVSKGVVLPRIVVLLDGYPAFAAAFERVDLGRLVDALPRLVADGRPLGIHFVITSERRGGVPSSLAGIVPLKIVLRMADPDEYAGLGLDARRMDSDAPPGRATLPSGLEAQIALPTEPPAPGPGEQSPPPVRLLPHDLASSSLPAPSRALQALFGIDDDELEPATLELDDGHALVIGPYGSGRSTALRAIVSSLRRGRHDLAFHLLAPRRTPLADEPLWSSVHQGVEATERFATDLAEQLDRASAEEFTILAIDDGEELAESSAAYALERIAKNRDAPVRVICAVEARTLHRAFGGWLAELRKSKLGLLLDPDLDIDGDLLGVRLPREFERLPGRAFLVTRGRARLVQVAR